MTIIEKIKQSVEGATGMPFLYHAAGELNELLSRCKELPVAYSFLIDSGTIDDVNGRYHERVTIAVMFCDKTEFDFNALENEQIIDRMKTKAYKWMQSLRMSNALRVISVNNTQRLYDNTTDILTGFAVNITIEDVAGVGECELPQVVVDVDKNGSYNVVGVDKVVVNVLPKLDELEVTRNGEYLPPTDIDGFSKVSVNVLEVGVDDAYNWIENRVKGSEDGTIPAIPLIEPLDGENLLENLSLLDNRRIDDGLTMTLEDGTTMPCPDGLSLAQLLCSSDVADKVTEIVDNNRGWVMDKNMDWTMFHNISKITLGFALWTVDRYEYPLVKQIAITELNLPEWREYSSYKNKSAHGFGVIWGVPIKSLYLPKFEKYDTPDNHSSSYEGLIYDCQELEEFIAPKLSYIRPLPNFIDNAMLSKCGALKKIVVGKLKMLTNYNYKSGADSFINTDCPNLIHFEIGEGSACSIRLTKWNPTAVLSDSEKLSIFLSNFKTYIAERLTDKGSGLTLTLSQEVRDAIQQDPEIVSIITSKGWTISPAPSV